MYIMYTKICCMLCAVVIELLVAEYSFIYKIQIGLGMSSYILILFSLHHFLIILMIYSTCGLLKNN